MFPALLFCALLLGAGPSTPPAAAAPDAWARVVAERADREAVVKALGVPPVSYPAVVDASRPMLVVPATIEPPAEGAPARVAVRVYQWPSDVEGLPWQVVMRDGKVWWAVGPPAADERDTAAITKKYGEGVASTEGVLRGDMHSEWEVLSHPAKSVAFVRRPGAKAVVARRLTAPAP